MRTLKEFINEGVSNNNTLEFKTTEDMYNAIETALTFTFSNNKEDYEIWNKLLNIKNAFKYKDILKKFANACVKLKAECKYFIDEYANWDHDGYSIASTYDGEYIALIIDENDAGLVLTSDSKTGSSAIKKIIKMISLTSYDWDFYHARREY